MNEESIRQAAEFYGISLDEAHSRYEIIQKQGNRPDDPICIGCAKRPEEFLAYKQSEDESVSRTRRTVIVDEGTYNPTNGHFLCDMCYIKNGMPTSERGWRAP